MKEFNLTAKMTISVYTKVEANTLNEAIEIAKEKEIMPIIQDGSYNSNDCWMTDELDGVVFDITEE